MTYSFAQKKKGIVYFKDNTSIEGLIKVKTFSGIKFKKSKDSEAINYTHEQIKGYDVSGWQFRYVEDPDTQKIKLYKLIYEGEISLYEKLKANPNSIEVINTTTNMSNGFAVGITLDIPVYFIKTNDEVLKIGNNLKNKHHYIFDDCPLLIEKIKNKEFKRWDLFLMVEFYNEDCN